MSTVADKLHTVEAVVEADIVKVGKLAKRIEVVIEDIVHDKPELDQIKSQLKQTLVDGSAIAAEIMTEVVAKGTNLALYPDLLGKIQNFFLGDLASELLPEIKRLDGTIETDYAASK